MRKIGIAIKPTISGNHHPVAINEGEWTRRIRDMRPALLHYPAMQKNHKLIASMFFFDETGCYIVISRTVTNNDLENVSGWIHIPYDMKISTAELEEIVRLMRHIVAQPVLPHRQYLQQTFGAKQYPDKPATQFFDSSPRNGIFAKRVQSKNQSLASLLGENLFLPSYANYETILVEEFPGEVTDAMDITQVCNNEQSQIEAEIKRRSRVPHGRDNRRVNPHPGHHTGLHNAGQNEKIGGFGQGERTKPTNFPPRQRGYTERRDEYQPMDGYVTPPVIPGNPTYGVSENPQNFFQKHGIGIIIGLVAGILIGILIMLPFRNNTVEEPIHSETDTLVTEGVIEEVTADSAITTTPTSEATASPSESVSDAPATTSSGHRSRRDKTRNSTPKESTGSYTPSMPTTRPNLNPGPRSQSAQKPEPKTAEKANTPDSKKDQKMPDKGSTSKKGGIQRNAIE